MNKPGTEIKQIGIIVIQSLSDKDRKTGDELNNDLLRYKEFIQENTFTELYNVLNVKEFVKCLKGIHKQMKKGVIFSLHFETHGSDDGLYLASGEVVKWKQFYQLIRPINISMGNLLIIVMAMCKGAALISSLEPEKRAPYLAFIGAFKTVSQDEIARGFIAFYGSYTSALDIGEGMQALTAEIDGVRPKDKTFWCYSSEHVFDKVLDSQLSPDNLKKLVDERLKKCLVEYGELGHTRESVEREIRSFLKYMHNKHKRKFCFKDLYGD